MSYTFQVLTKIKAVILIIGYGLVQYFKPIYL